MRPVLLRCISTEKIRELDPFSSRKEYVKLYYDLLQWNIRLILIIMSV